MIRINKLNIKRYKRVFPNFNRFIIPSYLSKIVIIISFVLIMILESCGKGISPEPEQVKQQTGFGGTITFKGKWPDSVKYTMLIVFVNPLKSDSDFSFSNLGFLSDTIPNNTKSVIYNSSVKPLVPIKPGKFSYIAVVQSKTLLLPLRKLWTVAGVYYNNGDTTKPGVLNIHDGQFTNDVNITCDFDNPPSQPPE